LPLFEKQTTKWGWLAGLSPSRCQKRQTLNEQLAELWESHKSGTGDPTMADF
jgi:hypothetical protein